MPEPAPVPLQSFLDTLKYEKRYSLHTIRAYQDDLTDFFSYLSEQYGTLALAEIAPSFIRSWLAFLKDQKLAAKSINRKLSALKSFFTYQLRVGNLEATPMTSVVAPKAGKRIIQYVDKKDIDKTVEFPDSWKGRTDSLIIDIFYNTGMRLGELTTLKEANVDIENQGIKVLGKGNKERIIPISIHLAQTISAYISEKRKVLSNFDATALLVGRNGKKLYHKYVYRVVHDHLEKITTLEKKSPHVLRHTFATHLMNAGADLNAVKELLGHSSLAATQVYTHASIEQLKEIHKKAHPRS